MKKLVLLFVYIVSMLLLCSCMTDVPELVAAEEEPEETKQEEMTEYPLKSDDIPLYLQLPESQALAGKNIVCSMAYCGDDWNQSLETALETLLSAYGAKIRILDADADNSAQEQQISDALLESPELLLIDPLLPDTANDLLVEAASANLPVVVFNQTHDACSKLHACFVGWEETALGRQAGEYVLETFQKENRTDANVALLYNPNNGRACARMEGVKEAIQDYVFYTEILTDGSRDGAREALNAGSDTYDYIIADMGETAIGAAEAVNHEKIPVVCCGSYTEEVYQILMEDESALQACVWLDPWIFAEKIAECAIQTLQNQLMQEESMVSFEILEK